MIQEGASSGTCNGEILSGSGADACRPDPGQRLGKISDTKFLMNKAGLRQEDLCI